jgi:hypothetical protein
MDAADLLMRIDEWDRVLRLAGKTDKYPADGSRVSHSFPVDDSVTCNLVGASSSVVPAPCETRGPPQPPSGTSGRPHDRSGRPPSSMRTLPRCTSSSRLETRREPTAPAVERQRTPDAYAADAVLAL